MAENEPKSKLRRKKPSVEDNSPKIPLNSAPRKPHAAAETHGLLWWSRQDLPAVEQLWASTLECVGLLSEERGRMLVPELPLPAAEESARGFDEESWCNITQEVPPLPPPIHKDDLGLSTADTSARSSLQPSLKTSSRDREQESGPAPKQMKKRKEDELPLQSLEVEAPQQRDVEEKKNVSEELQSCPMCLLVFPPRFTQLDRDGHLAQCLSDMNVDMTW